MNLRFPCIALVGAILTMSAVAEDGDRDDKDMDRSAIKHVLLISIDGMHAVDFKNCAHGIAGANSGSTAGPAVNRYQQ